MLAYIPIRFDVYRPLKAHLRWTLQCLIGFTRHGARRALCRRATTLPAQGAVELHAEQRQMVKPNPRCRDDPALPCRNA